MRSSLPTSHWYEPLPRPGVQPTPNPLPPSSKSNFVQQFEFVGTVDNASLLCIPAALKFRKEVCGGEEAGKFLPGGTRSFLAGRLNSAVIIIWDVGDDIGANKCVVPRSHALLLGPRGRRRGSGGPYSRDRGHGQRDRLAHSTVRDGHGPPADGASPWSGGSGSSRHRS